MYYTLRTITPELFMNRSPSSEISQKILNACPLVPLPKLPFPGSPRYILVRQDVIEKYKFQPIEVFKVMTMIHDVNILEDDNAMVAGFIAVQDFSGASLGMLKWMSPTLMKKVSTTLQQAYPYRIRAFHIFNIPTFIDVLINFLKPFLTEKNKKRMNVFSKLEDFYKVVPLEILPEEYGGQGGKIDDILQVWKKKLLKYEDWFIEDEKRKSDESKRIGEPKTEESVFGIQGSFRQLAVD